MSDPRDFDQRPGLNGLPERDIDGDSARSTNAMWGWIAGVVFLVIVFALIFAPGSGDNNSQTASNPPTNSMNIARPTASPMNPAGSPPSAAPMPSTTGQGPSTTGQGNGNQ
jgi:hypothetical protein